MNILILGGNRFFGKRLVQRLLRRGDTITLLNRGNFANDFDLRVAHVKADRKKIFETPETFQSQRWDIVYDQCAYDVEDATTACQFFEGRATRYIFTSTGSVYSEGAGHKEEAFDPHKYTFTEAADREKEYGEAKRQAEAVFFQRARFPVAAVRFPFVLGEDDYTDRLKFHVHRIRDEKPIYFPNLKARTSIVFAEDAARALEWIGFQTFEGPINCAAPEPISMAELVSLIEQATKMKAQLATQADSENQSPYGRAEDWFSSPRKLESLGFHVRPWPEWLPQLIRQSSAN